jgi:hypothetical protein
MPEGVSPFAKIYVKGERITQSAVCTSSLAAVLPAEGRIVARQGWAGENGGLFEQPASTSCPDIRREPCISGVTSGRKFYWDSTWSRGLSCSS